MLLEFAPAMNEEESLSAMGQVEYLEFVIGSIWQDILKCGYTYWRQLHYKCRYCQSNFDTFDWLS